MTRAKFKVTRRLETEEGFRVELEAVIEGSQENKKFFKYTPSGHLEMSLVQPETAAGFVPGKEFYLDFKEAN